MCGLPRLRASVTLWPYYTSIVQTCLIHQALTLNSSLSHVDRSGSEHEYMLVNTVTGSSILLAQPSLVLPTPKPLCSAIVSLTA
jgi:hypothetical protein